jgi:hypothetical protein
VEEREREEQRKLREKIEGKRGNPRLPADPSICFFPYHLDTQ